MIFPATTARCRSSFYFQVVSGSGASPDCKTMAGSSETSPLRVAIIPFFPPFIYSSPDGRVGGAEGHLWPIFAERLGVGYKYLMSNPRDSVQMVYEQLQFGTDKEIVS